MAAEPTTPAIPPGIYPPDSGEHSARQLIVGGQVQGVGFRPFVYRLARQYHLRGWVRNETGRVRIQVEGQPEELTRFSIALIRQAPEIARPLLHTNEAIARLDCTDFRILPSQVDAQAEIHLPPDYFTCPDCLAELNDPADRRYRYPFINCTQCGPRYTLIRRLPYDRPNTTMADFPLCPDCQREYQDPLDRRFHAQPLACPVCGPHLRFQRVGMPGQSDTAAALAACVNSLRAGLIVAVKGVGGYHLMCDARQQEAICHLRCSKPRPDKPLAVLVPQRGADGLAAVRELAELDEADAALLLSPMRPIVLLRKRADFALPDAIAPGLMEIGVMLPYSPLHHLLAQDFGGPLVATSANISGEPVLTDDVDVEMRLCNVADAYLHHNRPIQRPADDGVYRHIAGRSRPLRLGRGGSPLELDLPVALPVPVMALGAHMKNTVTLAWGRRAVISPHVGELDAPRSMAVFEQLIEDLQHIYQVRAKVLLCDAHPQYQNSRWAARRSLPVIKVFHHSAHASALYAEHRLQDDALVFTWDGTGYGEDASLWGGECLAGQPGQWRRVASFRPFRLPGGDRAAREPWRSALALCWEVNCPWQDNPHDNHLLKQAWERGLNAPASSAVGRLFDAAAAFTGLCKQASFEGQGPMYLEAACRSADDIRGLQKTLPLSKDDSGLWRTDWAPLLGMLQDSRHRPATRALAFHQSLAQALLDQALRLRNDTGIQQVGLCGGVFQNHVLTELATHALQTAGFSVYLAQRLPANDAGISFGQVAEAAASGALSAFTHGDPHG